MSDKKLTAPQERTLEGMRNTGHWLRVRKGKYKLDAAIVTATSGGDFVASILYKMAVALVESDRLVLRAMIEPENEWEEKTYYYSVKEQTRLADLQSQRGFTLEQKRGIDAQIARMSDRINTLRSVASEQQARIDALETELAALGDE